MTLTIKGKLPQNSGELKTALAKSFVGVGVSKGTSTTVLHVPPVEQVKALTEEQALTQEYLVLHQKYEELEVKRLMERMEDIKKHLATRANEMFDEDAVAVFTCEEGQISFSPRASVTEITNVDSLLETVEEKAGHEAVLSVVKVQLTPLKKILSEMELENFSKKVRGSRSLREVTHHK